MNVLIIGAGAMGMLFASRLSSVCEQIELIAHTEEQAILLRREGIDLIGENQLANAGLSITSFEKARKSKRSERAADYIMVMVKQSAMNESLASFIISHLAPHTLVVCFQNGMGHIENLAIHLPKAQIAAAVTTEGALKTTPRSVMHTGKGMTYIGFPFQTKAAPFSEYSLKIFVGLLEQAGLCIQVSKYIIKRMWEKLIVNAVINPLTGILRVANGELLKSEHCRQLMRAIYDEAIIVAKHERIEVTPDLWETLLEVCVNTADNFSSMQQDLSSGKRTEIEWITGYLLHIGHIHNLELPVNRAVYRLIKANEKQ